MWRSEEDVERIISTLPSLDRLDQMFALRTFWVGAFYPESYQASPDWLNVLVPTEYGSDFIDFMKQATAPFHAADVNLSLFRLFTYHDLIFDWEKSDVGSIRQILEEELRTGLIYLPFRFGRLLYDRFFELFEGRRIDSLSASDSLRLLTGTPVGVCQVSCLLSGPLGLLDSEEVRYIPPTRALPLWHCPDTGCQALHEVALSISSVPIVQAGKVIREESMKSFGVPSGWSLALASIHRRQRWPEARRYYDIAVLIANCIVGVDRTKLLEEVLKTRSGEKVRKAILSAKQIREGNPYKIASSLTGEEQLQALLIVKDDELRQLLDHLVERGGIGIPIGQILKPQVSAPRFPRDSASQLSALGVRSEIRSPLPMLIRTVKNAYSGSGLLNELEWRLRSQSGSSIEDSLFGFVRNNGPADVVRNLILTSHLVTEKVCVWLDVEVSRIVDNEDRGIDILLWKFGFSPPRFQESWSLLGSRLEELNETVLECTPIQSEAERERIRAAGVNLFVSAEDFLDKLLCYNIWIMSSDHFIETNFEFDLPRARRRIAEVLGSDIACNGESYRWRDNGENALGTLLLYLRAAVEWMVNLKEQDRDEYRRPKDDLPHFTSDPVVRFPFLHTALWADTEPQELQAYVDKFSEIVRLIEQAGVAAIRNGLDHWRDDDRFPGGDSILACIARLREALDVSDKQRFLPKSYWLESYTTSRFAHREYVLADYRGRRFTLYGPALVSGLPNLEFEKQVLVAPGNLLGGPNSQLVFLPKENSEYQAYWEGYPRRARAGRDVTGKEMNEHGSPDATSIEG